jgi:hypothetical protein
MRQATSACSRTFEPSSCSWGTAVPHRVEAFHSLAFSMSSPIDSEGNSSGKWARIIRNVGFDTSRTVT